MDNGPRFRDRQEAGARLAEALDQYRGQDVLVLGIPRGGVPVAAEVERMLGEARARRQPGTPKGGAARSP